MPQDPQTWDFVKTLVADALEMPVEQRETYLRGKCDGKESLLHEALALIGAYESADGVIDSRTDAWLGLGGPDLLALGGQRIGRYVLDRLLAEGAMAAVYIARQKNPDRAVALKLVRTSLPLIDAAHRFKREADALGRLQHPNIARIYEAGLHRAGKNVAMPFIAMEYVNGAPLTDFARQNKLSREDRLRLMIKVASAVQAAHQQAVIHRDLKPANVLVDQTGEPKVLDFGIARIIGAEEEHFTWQTTAGVLLGTPGYMSPEQASGKAQDVDVRSDVWSLGVLLHELLTEKLPIDVKNTSVVEVLRRIETAEPPPLSSFDRSLRGDLETIVGTALSREKQRRYPSAEAFAKDLQHVLDYEPITARQPSTWYRLQKFARRHRVGLSFAATLTVLLITALITSTFLFLQARRERDRAEAMNTFLRGMLLSADPTVGRKDMTVVEAIEESIGGISTTFAGDPATEGDVRYTIGWTLMNLGQFNPAIGQLAHAADLHRQTYGTVHPTTLRDISRLATVLRFADRSKEARTLAQNAYDAALEKLGPENPATLDLVDPLAGAMYDENDAQPAIALYEKALPAMVRVIGERDMSTLRTMNNLALIYLNQGELTRAEAMFRHVIDVRKGMHGGEGLVSLMNRQNLALTLHRENRLAEAEAMFSAQLAEARKGLGEDHSTTLLIEANLANVYYSLNRPEDAMALERDLYERNRRLFGDASEKTLWPAARAGGYLNTLDRCTEAEQLARRVIDAALPKLGADNAAIAAQQQNLGAALDNLGRYAEAEPYHRAALAVYLAKYGPEAARTLVVLNNLGRCLVYQGRSQEGLDVLQPLLAVFKQKPFTWIEPAVHKNIGKALLQMRRFSEAENEYLIAYDQNEKLGYAPYVVKCARALAELYDAWGKPQEASSWRAKASTQPATTQAKT